MHFSESVPVRQQQLARLQDDVAKLRQENEQLREARDKLEIQLESLSEGKWFYWVDFENVCKIGNHVDFSDVILISVVFRTRHCE